MTVASLSTFLLEGVHLFEDHKKKTVAFACEAIALATSGWCPNFCR